MSDEDIEVDVQEDSEEVPNVNPKESFETTEQEGDLENSEESIVNKNKPLRLPMARVKNIIKSDPDCSIISQDAVYLIAKATEFFIEFLGKEAVKFTLNTKRKTVSKRDVDSVINEISQLYFLEGALEW